MPDLFSSSSSSLQLSENIGHIGKHNNNVERYQNKAFLVLKLNISGVLFTFVASDQEE